MARIAGTNGKAPETTDFVAFERSGWARRAGTYDRGFGLLAAGAHQALLDAVAAGQGVRLLEVGCGTGQLARTAVARGAKVFATDAAENMTAFTSGAAPEARVICAALPMLPFDDNAFDAAVGAFVLNHVPTPLAAIGELARVIHPGGVIALSCWDTDENNRAQGIFVDALAVVNAPRPAGLPVDAPFIKHATEEGFADLMRRSGLHDVGVVRVTWTHRVDPDLWWHDVLTGTVLTSARIEGQDADTRHRIRSAYNHLAGQYRVDEHVVGLPAAALVAVGIV